MSIEVGGVVEGVVTGITNFGAFIELPGGKVGLVHISEVADVYVRDVKDFLKEQDKVKVKVLSIDDRGKIGLSIKQLQQSSDAAAGNGNKIAAGAGMRRPIANENRRPNKMQFRAQGGLSFEDKLNRFIKDSDERLADLKRNTESKRGGRGARRG